MIHRRQLGQLRQLNAQYAEAIVEYRAGVVIVERMIERKQNDGTIEERAGCVDCGVREVDEGGSEG
jgi:hypothetical protein